MRKHILDLLICPNTGGVSILDLFADKKTGFPVNNKRIVELALTADRILRNIFGKISRRFGPTSLLLLAQDSGSECNL